ncbi:MAG: hypothetical protein KCHDKBKB_02051 [Elusimicrobia bacterium]|nr:hypothetical protein [Elusimicrobiota bacterium]
MLIKIHTKKLKLYLDTTIPNYVYADDSPERTFITKQFMHFVRCFKHEAFISRIVIEEIKAAAEPRRSMLLREIEGLTITPMSIEAEELAKLYISEQVMNKNSLNDARHIALATLNGMDAIVSWNFKDMVNISRIKGIHTVNKKMGLNIIEIITPQEVIGL